MGSFVYARLFDWTTSNSPEGHQTQICAGKYRRTIVQSTDGNRKTILVIQELCCLYVIILSAGRISSTTSTPNFASYCIRSRTSSNHNTYTSDTFALQLSSSPTTASSLRTCITKTSTDCPSNSYNPPSNSIGTLPT